MSDFPNLTSLSVEQRDRLKQRQIRPAVVKSRALSDFIFGSATASASTSLDDGDQVVVSITISQNSGFSLLGIPYIAVYADSIAAANQLPGGSAIDESEWQVIGPFYDWADWNSNNFSASKEYVTLYIRNISAGNGTAVYIETKHRYISPREGGS